jgi:putative phage-type endonuclease
MFGFSEEEILDLELEIHNYVEEYLQNNGVQQCQPDFYKTMIDTITQEFLDDFICSGVVDFTLDLYDKMFRKFRRRVHHFVKNYYSIHQIPRRCYKNPRLHTYDTVDKEVIRAQIQHLQGIKQPAQRTAEWYAFRHNLITASNIWKAIGSEANKNSLICEKCKPNTNIATTSLNSLEAPAAPTSVNTESPLHWGVKYEPLTVMLYEKRNKVKVGEFGCIQHPLYSFIGASPDGIVISEDSPAYGRMLEIKNVVSREITGIPKMDYWVQMQIQMEVCNLNECDFLETQFKEYDETEEDLFYKNKHQYLYNGLIVFFLNRDFVDGTHHYVYMHFNIRLSKADVGAWVDSQKVVLKDTHILFKRIYWYCETYSCVLVKRNRHWFELMLPKVKEIWDIIEKERVEGYEHRLPKKRVPAADKKKCLIDASVREELENL